MEQDTGMWVLYWNLTTAESSTIGRFLEGFPATGKGLVTYWVPSNSILLVRDTLNLCCLCDLASFRSDPIVAIVMLCWWQTRYQFVHWGLLQRTTGHNLTNIKIRLCCNLYHDRMSKSSVTFIMTECIALGKLRHMKSRSTNSFCTPIHFLNQIPPVLTPHWVLKYTPSVHEMVWGIGNLRWMGVSTKLLRSDIPCYL